ncbi:hypothetical protein SAMN06296386_1207 [Lachnospiraceae bacterium]|nr:hypothetical protein SAMN06296386_1207 [Lachnospiraceae bacterium]
MTRKKIKFLALMLSSALLVPTSGALSTPAFASEVSSEISNESIPDDASHYNVGATRTHEFIDNSRCKYLWYKFTLDKSVICKFTSSFETKESYNPKLYIFDKYGEKLCDIYPNHHDMDSDYVGLRKGHYFIKVECDDVVNGLLSFKLATVEPSKNYQSFVEDYEIPDTFNDSYKNASDITQGNIYHGIIGSNNYEDWYKLTASTDTTITFKQTSFKGNEVQLAVYDSSHDKKLFSESVTGGETITKDFQKGTYYVHVSDMSTPNDATIANVLSFTISSTSDPSGFNQPSESSNDVRGEFSFSYNHEISFWGRSKIGLSNFGGIAVSYNGAQYEVQKAVINKKKHTIQIKSLKGADKALNKAVKVATKGSNALTFTVKPYMVSNADKTIIKKKKDGTPRSVKIFINKKPYTAKKTEYTYDSASNLISFTGNNLTGSCNIKN